LHPFNDPMETEPLEYSGHCERTDITKAVNIADPTDVSSIVPLKIAEFDMDNRKWVIIRILTKPKKPSEDFWGEVGTKFLPLSWQCKSFV
ncbi:MAG: hypothetical protein Q4E74_12140, partial [Ruminococcus sp.]|nr:hypothetical protein [Ruminococcus sp.]